MFKLIRFFLILFGLFCTTGIYATDTELKNLRWDWEVFDYSEGHFVPYYELTNTQSIRFEINLNKYRNSHLKLILPKNYFIWIDDQLVEANLENSTKYLALDSLYALYDKGRLNMTIYSKWFDGDKVETVLVNQELEMSSLVEETVFLKRNNHSRLDRFVIISIITLSLIALFRTFYYRLFQEYFSISKSIQLRQNFDLITAHSPLAWPNIGFMLFYAVLIGNTAMNVDLFQSNLNSDILFGSISRSNILLGLKIAVVCFLLMIGKLLLISLGTELFKIKKVRPIHFFTYFRLSLIIALLAFSFSVVNGVFDGNLANDNWHLIGFVLAAVWIARLILIFFVLNKIYTFRKLHLFSYLCSSELIPLLLFFKIFLK